jgi:multiple sugar transport system permease protein
VIIEAPPAGARGIVVRRSGYDRALAFAGRWFTTGLTFLLAAVFLLPLFWMLSVSGQTVAQTYAAQPVWWPSTFHFGNYSTALKAFPFLEYAFNTFKIAVPYTLGTLVSSALVAYSFGCLRWPGQNVVFYIVLATMMVPQWLTVVPLYVLYAKLGLVGTYYPLWVPAFFGDPFSIFLLRQFFLTIPRELLLAARVDGATHFRIFRSIVLPLSRPALSVVVLFAFIYSWTDFFLPLVYLSNPNTYTLQLGLYQFFGRYYVSWPGFMAACVLVLLPVLLLFLATQRTFLEGIATTGFHG